MRFHIIKIQTVKKNKKTQRPITKTIAIIKQKKKIIITRHKEKISTTTCSLNHLK